MIKQIGKTNEGDFIITLSYTDKIILMGALAISLEQHESEDAQRLLENLRRIQ